MNIAPSTHAQRVLLFTLILAVIVLSFLVGKRALAGPAPIPGKDITSTPIIQKYLRIAAQYWHHTPTSVAHHSGCERYKVVVSKLAPETGPSAVAEADTPGCWLRYSPNTWRQIQSSLAGEDSDYGLREGCVLAVHEFGHSLGHKHSTDPDNVMYPYVSIASVNACNTTYPGVISGSETDRIWHQTRLHGWQNISPANTPKRQ